MNMTVQNIFSSSNYLVWLPRGPPLPWESYVDLRLVCSDILDMSDVASSTGRRNSDGRDENNQVTSGSCQFLCNPPGRWSSKKLSRHPSLLESRGALDSCWELLHPHLVRLLWNAGHRSGEMADCRGGATWCRQKWWGGLEERDQ
jgi:hypothetical protein